MWAFVIKKLAGIFTSVVTKWRIIAFIFSVISSLYAYHAFKVANLKKEIKQASDKVGSLQVEIGIIKLSNKAFILVQNELEKANRNCVLNNKANSEKAEQALIQLKKSNNTINEKYKELANRKVDSVCGNTIIDVKLFN